MGYELWRYARKPIANRSITIQCSVGGDVVNLLMGMNDVGSSKSMKWLWGISG